MKLCLIFSVFILMFNLCKGQNNDNTLIMTEQKESYTLEWVERVDTVKCVVDNDTLTLRFEIRRKSETGSRSIEFIVAHFIQQDNRYLVETRVESDEYPFSNVGTHDETWYATIYPENTPMITQGYADEELLYADVFIEYWKGKTMPETIAARLTRLNWWAMHNEEEVECYENLDNCRYENYIVSGETQAWVMENKEKLKKLGTKVIWNNEKNKYQLKE